MKRIVVKITGGLGNQLFQYALARYLADRTRREIAYDLTDFTVSHLRKFQLPMFQGPAAFRRWGAVREWSFFLLWILNRKVSTRAFQFVMRLRGAKWLWVRDPFRCQPDFADESLRDWPGPIYLSGCYGHVPHMPARDVLRKELVPVAAPNGCNAAYLGQIRDSDSVSVHVRRTDYLWASNGSPSLPVGYQRRAIAEMRRRVARPKWFVFSDDLEWCRREFADLEDAVFVDGNGDEPWEDLRLMAACRHHIIANSTFSWWGAYLGRDDGITFYPDPWFGDSLSLPESGRDPRWEPIASRGGERAQGKPE